MYWEHQPELPNDKGSNWSRGATRDIGSPPLYEDAYFSYVYSVSSIGSFEFYFCVIDERINVTQ